MSRQFWFGGALLAFAALLTPAAQAADKRAIDQAIERGVAFLKQGQSPDGSWQHINPGATALVALTLLECGVPANDPAVRRAADYLRKVSVTMTHTYSVSLCILFFDRLGDPGDVALVESLTVRLLTGQSNQGGWTYLCPQVSEGETRRLSGHLQRQAEMVARRELPGAVPKRTPNELPKEIKDQLARFNGRQAGKPEVAAGVLPEQLMVLQRDDNSNTQFAILALWVGRRHGLPVDAALARAERYFRRTQNADGGWSYLPTLGGVKGVLSSTPAMTCAGLLGLALGYGATGEAVLRTDTSKPLGAIAGKAAGRNLAGDRAVGNALALLATAIGQPLDKAVAPAVRIDLVNQVARNGTVDYYYLWSLERVAMIYGLKTIGKKDWYAWGSDVLVLVQEEGGSWTGKYSLGAADTCFALLFLCRSNLAQDLTNTLRGKLRDAGEVQLRSGGFPKDEGKLPPSESSAKPAANVGAPPAKPVEPKPFVRPPVIEPTREVQRLTESLVRAPAQQREAVLTELVESKGPVYTDALAAAIPQLTGEAKQQARDGLVKRLARMTPATLRDLFKEEHVEIRRAAALAVELKGARPLIPDLIALLEDADRTVSRAAHAALKEMTRQDFGPAAQATAAERSQSVARWKAWWAKQN